MGTGVVLPKSFKENSNGQDPFPNAIRLTLAGLVLRRFFQVVRSSPEDGASQYADVSFDQLEEDFERINEIMNALNEEESAAQRPVVAANSTDHTFVSAESDETGQYVTATFTRALGVPPCVSQIASDYNVDLDVFYRAVFDLTVDGRKDLMVSAAAVDSGFRFRMSSPGIRINDPIRISYDCNHPEIA